MLFTYLFLLCIFLVYIFLLELCFRYKKHSAIHISIIRVAQKKCRNPYKLRYRFILS
ncbi:hypothetical protein BH10CHL1_BH10CHL1_04360 [soil metagenome]